MITQNKTQRLRFSSAPKPDESFVGYLLRLAELNRCPTPSWILEKAEIERYWQKMSFVFDHTLSLSPLAALTGVEESKLNPLLYHPAGGARRVAGDFLVFGWPVS